MYNEQPFLPNCLINTNLMSYEPASGQFKCNWKAYETEPAMELCPYGTYACMYVCMYSAPVYFEGRLGRMTRFDFPSTTSLAALENYSRFWCLPNLGKTFVSIFDNANYIGWKIYAWIDERRLRGSFLTSPQGPRGELGPHGWNLSPRGNVRPFVHPWGWTLSSV
jgi:hypothetical protein